jgi:hypothetical protein
VTGRDDAGVRRLIVSGLLCLVALSMAPGAAASAPPDDQPIATNDFLDLERDLSECISAVPKPGCGREPTQAGDRGGSLQLALFGVMMTGVVVIGWRVTAAVRARDRAGAER